MVSSANKIKIKHENYFNEPYQPKGCPELLIIEIFLESVKLHLEMNQKIHFTELI